MKKSIVDDNLLTLYDAILHLETIEECDNFFEDLCTISELKAMSQRYHVAKMLHVGTVYTDIVEQTKASTATISRVNRSLLYGTGGYETAIGRQKDK